MSLSLVALLFCCKGAAAAADIRVIATGDSLTCQYAGVLAAVFDQAGIGAVVPNPVVGETGSVNTARGGMNCLFYTGQLAFTNEQAVNYSANVLAADPDVILYMLGTNDVWTGTLTENAVSTSLPSTAFGWHKNAIGPVFDQFAGFTNSRGRHPVVCVASVLPFDLEKNQARWNTTSNSGALDRIENWYNPWLRDQAALHGFTYVDAWTAIQQDPDWKAKYMAADDGLHLSTQGSLWIAAQFAQALNGPFAVVWTGAVNGVWDSHATANFDRSPAGTFRDGDSVSFNDAGIVTSIEIVAGGVAPGNLDFSNTTAREYRFAGGPIKGATGLTVSGGGHVTLNNANTYTGTTTIAAGVLTLAAPAATKQVIVGVDGTLELSTTGAVRALPPDASIANDGILRVTSGGQAVGAVDGPGSTTVNGSLTADSIVQDTLAIGAGGSVTIRQSTSSSVNATWTACFDSKWLTAENWSPNTVPNVAGATANFAGNLPTTVTVDGPVTAGAISFTTDIPYTINATNTNGITMRQVGLGGVASIRVAWSGARQTVNAPLVIATDTEIIGSGSLTTGHITTNTGQLLTIGTSVTADAIDGAGSTVVEGDLIAGSIVQDSLTIDAGGSVTIRPTAGGAVNAVPEPSACIVLSTGAIALLGAIWRRRRTPA